MGHRLGYFVNMPIKAFLSIERKKGYLLLPSLIILRANIGMCNNVKTILYVCDENFSKKIAMMYSNAKAVT